MINSSSFVFGFKIDLFLCEIEYFLLFFLVSVCNISVSLVMLDSNSVMSCVILNGIVCPLMDTEIDEDSRREWSGQ